MNRVILGDARELIRSLPEDPERQVIITDPVWPNPITELEGSDRPYELFAEVAEHFPKVAKRVIIVLGVMSDPRFLAGMPRELPFIRAAWLQYVKPRMHGRSLISADIAYIFGDYPKPISHPPNLLPGVCHWIPSRSVARARGMEHPGGHPCPRNTMHMDWIVRNWTDPDDVIIDPFAGSGTTLWAAVRNGRKAIGFEIDPDFVDQANTWIQTTLLSIPMNEKDQGRQALFEVHHG